MVDRRAYITETAGQLNPWLNAYDAPLRRMTDFNFDFFLIHVVLYLYKKKCDEERDEEEWNHSLPVTKSGLPSQILKTEISFLIEYFHLKLLGSILDSNKQLNMRGHMEPWILATCLYNFPISVLISEFNLCSLCYLSSSLHKLNNSLKTPSFLEMGCHKY